jgi:phytol kinase
MIALGYLLTFGWVFLVLGLTLVLKKKTGADDEVSRKIVHICVAFAYIPMYFCFGSTWHLLVPPAVFIVLNAVSYRRGLFAAMERTDESKKSLGTVYYAVSMTVMGALCVPAPRCLPCYAMGLFCMALGDGFAPIFGAIRRGNRRLLGKRTLYGSLSIFVICLLVSAGISALFRMGLPVWAFPLLALAATALELVGARGLDNLTLPLGVFLLSTLLMLKAGA